VDGLPSSQPDEFELPGLVAAAHRSSSRLRCRLKLPFPAGMLTVHNPGNPS
jgi:hypothetical protein